MAFVGGLKCLIFLNSSQLVKEFITTRKDIWKDHLLHDAIWEGQEVAYEQVVKLRMEGVPIVLCDYRTYQKVAETIGRALARLGDKFPKPEVSVKAQAQAQSSDEAAEISFFEFCNVPGCWCKPIAII